MLRALVGRRRIPQVPRLNSTGEQHCNLEDCTDEADDTRQAGAHNNSASFIFSQASVLCLLR